MSIDQHSMSPQLQQPETSTSVDVVTAVARAKGVSALDLSPPLGSVIETDALDRLFESRVDVPEDRVRRLQFPYNGYRVTVSGGGDVSLEELEAGGR